MSAGVCGKRLGFKEIFGSSTSPSSSAAKRFRCSNFGSPVRSSEFGFGSEDKLLFLIRNLDLDPNTDPEVARAPDGNGGVYSDLKTSRLLEDMAMRGVRYIDCYGVNNALVRVADPTFVGYFMDKGVAAAAKVVRKAYPQEKVGVFAQKGKGGPISVVEYTELDQQTACAINQGTGRLRFCWSNVCLHMFTLDFLNQVANGLEKDSIYHLAEKKIPSVHGFINGLKLEQFIFDAFTYAPTTALFEVPREEEFAPVKNANGTNYDTPDSARLLVLRLHSRWSFGD